MARNINKKNEIIKLSESSAGKKWLKHFSLNDVQTAAELLDYLIVVNNDNLKKELETLIVAVHEKARQNAYPFAIYVAFEPDRRKKFWKNGTPVSPNPSKMGSEGELLHFSRDFCKRHRGYFACPSLKKLRSKKVRTIVILDDFIGSGTRINSFFDWMYDDSTIKSWVSGGFINFIVIAYASTYAGEAVVNQNPFLANVQSCLKLEKGRSSWNKKDYLKYEDFCKRHFCSNPKNPDDSPIGYKEIFSMILFEHGMPNDNPQILRKLKINQLDFGKISLCNVDREKLSFANKGELSAIKDQLIYQFLLVLEKSRMKDECKLSDFLEISLIKMRKLIKKCKILNLIDADMFLTIAGQNFLRYYADKSEDSVEKEQFFYYY